MSWGRELDDGTLVFPQRGDPPAEKLGYQRDPGNPYNLIPLWVPCKFRSTGFAPCDCPGNNGFRKFLACKHGIKVSAKVCQDCTLRVEGESEADTQVLRDMWRELHINTQPGKAWWGRFVEKIPCPDCQAHTRTYAEANPPPLMPAVLDENKFFEWGVAFHNAVNIRKGKPVMELEAARKMYRNPLRVLR